ncbi:polyprenyl synthetase family protein [Streptomyces flavalbus]|uniref:Polyprenyl synthetase family protein n=1 Tax=Streptomyces flavalbus TaxID=2665155 RepID=A0ABW2WN32_9ACTN
MPRQDPRTLFGFDGRRFAPCYDPGNRRARAFADAFGTLPDGSDLRRLELPVEHLAADRFRLYGALDLAALRREVDGPYREVLERLAGMPLFGYNDSPLALRHHQAWAEHVGRAALSASWHHHYAAALVIHVYRRTTPPERQGPAHMRLVYAVAAAADLLTSMTLVTDDWLDGSGTRNGRPAWHLRHPRSFANDHLIMAVQALNVLRWVVPDHHPLKRQMYDRAVRQIGHIAHYFAYHAVLDLRRDGGAPGADGADGAAPRPVPLDDLTLDAYESVTFSRATDWVDFMVALGRLLACYGDGIPDGGAFTEYLAGATTAACVIDDLVDADTGEDVRTGEPTIQLCLAVHKAKGLLGPVSEEDAADIRHTLTRHLGVDDAAHAGRVLRMYERHGVTELALDYLEGVLEQLPRLRRAAREECGAPGDLPAFLLRWLAIDRGGATERAGDCDALLGQERFRELVARLARPEEGDGLVRARVPGPARS